MHPTVQLNTPYHLL